MTNTFFSESLLIWYENNKRDLPWRDTKDPYIIWLSEVILQQTRVAQGLPYFLRFTNRYPNVQSFANAKENEILKLWQGLGYYSRARNMLKTAKAVTESGNRFPSTYDQLIQLKGIGEYTASAIASFSSNEHVAVVDGNVYRVLSRFFGIQYAIDQNVGRKYFKSLAIELLPDLHSDRYNQAIMEFGALQCKPKKPTCSTCPLAVNCLALKQGIVSQLPIKSKRQLKKKVYLHYLVFKKGDKILIRHRQGTGVWEGLYDFVSIEMRNEIEEPEISKYANETFNTKVITICKTGKQYKHVLSHIEYQVHFWEIEVENKFSESKHLQWIDYSLIGDYPVSRLVEKYLNG